MFSLCQYPLALPGCEAVANAAAKEELACEFVRVAYMHSHAGQHVAWMIPLANLCCPPSDLQILPLPQAATTSLHCNRCMRCGYAHSAP